MKAVILCGGLGTRLREETEYKPKPMVEIGGKPILWHIMKMYSAHGIYDFVLCLGYKGYMIKEYFANYFLHTSDVTFDIKKNKMEVRQNHAEPWRVTLVNTGEDTLTGGRIKRIKEHVKGQTFCLTYGDGVGDVDISAAISLHKKSKVLATLTAVQSPGRFGVLAINKKGVTNFREKISGDEGWINGGFFVLEPGVLNYIKGDSVRWEAEPLEVLAREGQLAAYKHHGFWFAMDTIRDREHLEELWRSGKASWKVWP